MEVWIYFSFLEFWLCTESGTLPSVFQIICHPQDVVVSPTTLSLGFHLKGGGKTALDKPLHPAKIQ